MRQSRDSHRIQIAIAPGMACPAASTRGATSQATGREGGHDLPWTVHIRTLDEALAKKNFSAAARAWRQAYEAAAESQRWQGLVAVASASLRIGEAAGFRKASEAKARWICVAALFRAREQKSLDGVLRTAEAFAELGDREAAARPPDC